MSTKQIGKSTPHQLLRAAREAHGWSQQELADHIGAPRHFMVSRWESGVTSPSPYYRKKLCDLFGKSAQELGLVPSAIEDSRPSSSSQSSQEQPAICLISTSEAREPTEQGRSRICPTIKAPLGNVPLPVEPLIGRKHEVQMLSSLLHHSETRLVSLTGPGGVGKTRLAVEVAYVMRSAFADGVFFVSFASIRDPMEVVPAIAHILGIKEREGQTLFERMKSSLREKHLLLVLDNFEQVMAAGMYLEDLLQHCPALTVVVTSRVVLRLRGEQQFPLSPLTLPDLQKLVDIEAVRDAEAVALFVHHARAVLPTFQLTPKNAPTITRICVHLEGLPLAIELAAARLNLFSPQALLARLTQERLSVLTRGSRTLPERQQTLRDALKWSYELLSEQEQWLFRRLSVFVGGCTLKTLEEMYACSSEQRVDVVNMTASLIDNSLLQASKQEEEGAEDSRLLMLETIREYGLECLRASGEAESCQRTHAVYYVALAEQWGTHLRGGGQQEVWLWRLDQERGNLQAALDWLVEHEEAELVLRLSGALWWYWYMRGYQSEALHWLTAALRLPPPSRPSTAQARALSGAGFLMVRQGDSTAADELLEQSLALSEELGDTRGLAEALMYLGEVQEHRYNDYAAARALKEQSVALCREVGEKWLLALALNELAVVVQKQGDTVMARALLEEGIALNSDLRERWGQCRPLAQLASITLDEGNYEQATALTQERLAIAQEMGDMLSIVRSLIDLGNLAKLQGSDTEAAALYQQGLEIAQDIGDQHFISWFLCNLGDIVRSPGDYTRAARLYNQGLAVARGTNDRRIICVLLRILGDIALAQGTHEQAVAYYYESLSLAQKLKYRQGIGRGILGLARVAGITGQLLRAGHLAGTAEAFLNVNKDMAPMERVEYEHEVAHIRAQLGEKAFTLTRAQGHSMAPEQALTDLCINS